MKRFTSNFIALTLFSLCLIIDALPPLHNLKIVSNANHNSSDENSRIDDGGLKGRKNDAQSKCGYEVK